MDHHIKIVSKNQYCSIKYGTISYADMSRDGICWIIVIYTQID